MLMLRTTLSFITKKDPSNYIDVEKSKSAQFIFIVSQATMLPR